MSNYDPLRPVLYDVRAQISMRNVIAVGQGKVFTAFVTLNDPIKNDSRVVLFNMFDVQHTVNILLVLSNIKILIC